jgi:NRAMP (natural resistance-associated macrophage protein)-like metal ion transporter
MNFFKRCCRAAGPGIVTGAADNDPSGIATYSQAGAQFGFGQLWTAIFILPLQTAVQEACARIGLVTKQGIASVIKKHYGYSILYVVMFLLLIANIINIAADIGAMAAAVQLIVPLNFTALSVFFTVTILLLEIFIPYRKYANLLKWLCLTLLAYPITVFLVHAHWQMLLKATFIPHVEFSFQFLFILTGILGTTISPYLFFWEASQEVEEEKSKHVKFNNKMPNRKLIFNMRVDNLFGMVFSQICAWSIIAVAGIVLHAHGITEIKNAADAAKALAPFAGNSAEIIFAVGIVGLGLLSIPVLAGSLAYAFSETFNWKWGLNLELKAAPHFYGVIIMATSIGLLINLIGIDPIKSLVYAAVINGVVAVPLIGMIALIANNKNIMGQYRSKLFSNLFIWSAFFIMIFVAFAMFFAL